MFIKKYFPILILSLLFFSCDEEPIEKSGCTDPESCSYDSEVTIYVPGSCLYLDECGECGGDGIDEGACDCAGNV